MRTETSIKNLRLKDIIGIIDFRSLIHSKPTKSMAGRPLKYQLHQLMAAVFIQHKDQIPSDKELARRLMENESYKKFCEFTKDTPSHDTISRFKNNIKLNEVKKIFKNLDSKLDSFGIFNEDDLSIDGTDIPSHSNPRKKTDKDAGIGHTSLDDKFFGYWAMIAVGTESEIPREIILSPGDRHQQDQALELIPMLDEISGKEDRALIMDGIFDTKEIYSEVEWYGFKPVIKVNKRRGEYRFIWEFDDYNWRLCHEVPEKDEWLDLYSKRISAERFNSRLKELVEGENVRVMGLSKVFKHVLFSCITLQISALVTGMRRMNNRKWAQLSL